MQVWHNHFWHAVALPAGVPWEWGSWGYRRRGLWRGHWWAVRVVCHTLTSADLGLMVWTDLAVWNKNKSGDTLQHKGWRASWITSSNCVYHYYFLAQIYNLKCKQFKIEFVIFPYNTIYHQTEKKTLLMLIQVLNRMMEGNQWTLTASPHTSFAFYLIIKYSTLYRYSYTISLFSNSTTSSKTSSLYNTHKKPNPPLGKPPNKSNPRHHQSTN